jgi:hypothetical protein
MWSSFGGQLYPPHLTAEGKERKRKAGAGSKSTLETDADRLLFALVYMKTNPPTKIRNFA